MKVPEVLLPNLEIPSSPADSIAAAICVSPGVASGPKYRARETVQVASMAIYGANDKEASAFWSKAGQWAKPTTDKYRYKNSGVKPIKGTSLVGSKLLMNDTLDVPKVLEEYLQEAVKKIGEGRLWSEQSGPDRPTPFEVQRLFR